MKPLMIAAASLIAVTAAAQQPAPRPMNGGLPFVSPDGKWITFVADRTGARRTNLFVVGTDGTGEKQLTSEGGGLGRWLSPTQIYFVVPRQGPGGPAGPNDSTTILSVAPTGGAPTPLMRIAGREIGFSPDGKWIIAPVGQFPKMKMVATPRAGGPSRDLTDGSAPTFNPAFSSDGTRLAYARMEPDRQLQIWVMNIDGTNSRQLTKFTADDGSPQWPSWSPDGKWIAVQAGKYDRNNPAGNTAHIWLIHAETGEAKKLAAHDKPYLDETPSFFPDGKRIAFQSDRTGRMEIWVMNVDGTGARQVTR